MKKVFIIIFCFFMLKNPVFAISASSYIVMDMDSGKVFSESSSNSKHLIASTSKIMTCIIAIENGDLNKKITADKDILKAVGSSIYIEIGEQMTLKDLLYGMMMRSGNDASVLIAKAISGSMENFASLMNDYAKKIGMKNSFFYNSHGLEEKDGNGNTSTAYDMALLTSYAMKNKTFQKIFKTQKYTAKSDKKTYVWNSKNKLLKYDFITGGKTGYTIKAHRTLVTTGIINGINTVIVTLNDGNDWQDHLSLYDYVKDNYINYKVISKDTFKIVDSIIYGNDKLYIKNDVDSLLKIGEEKFINVKYVLYSDKNYRNNTKVGDIEVYLNNKLINKEPIYVEMQKNKKSFKNFLKNLFK